MKCKWCREEIVQANMSAGSWSAGMWIHASESFTCRMHPETVAEPADERWENVYASIRPPEKIAEETPTNLPDWLKNTYELRTEVRYKGQLIYQVTRVSKQEAESCVLDVFQMAFRKQIKALDKALDEFDQIMEGIYGSAKQ